MRYTFANDGGREALLKRYYRGFQFIVGSLIAGIGVFCLVFPAYARAYGIWGVLAFSGYGIGSALYLHSRLKKDGIDPKEWQSYIWRQPMMVAMGVIAAIITVIHFFQVFFPK